MARLRTIKPGFFLNDALGELAPIARLLFVGLWCLADREGRVADRPRRIRAEILPYDDGADVDGMLEELAARGFIQRYEVSGVRCIQVVQFARHQMPHPREAPSALPAPPSSGAPAEAIRPQAQPEDDETDDLGSDEEDLGSDLGSDEEDLGSDPGMSLAQPRTDPGMSLAQPRTDPGQTEVLPSHAAIGVWGVGCGIQEKSNTGEERPALMRARAHARGDPSSVSADRSPQAALLRVAAVVFGRVGATESERRRQRTSAHELVVAGVTPDELGTLVAAYRRRGWPNPSLKAIAANLEALRAPDEPGRRPREPTDRRPPGYDALADTYRDLDPRRVTT